MKKILTAGLILSAISGCSVVGEEESVCPGTQTGAACMNAREIHEITNNYATAEEYFIATGDDRVVFINKDGEIVADKKKALAGIESGEVKAVSADYFRNQNTAIDGYRANENSILDTTLPAPDPIAMRKSANIVRVLVRPYVDSDDRLQVPGYSYVEAKERTWIIDRNAQYNSAMLTPLSVRSKSAGMDTGTNDNGELGVTKRDGKPSAKDVKAKGKQNALTLLNDLKESGAPTFSNGFQK
ncbi:TraV family lipoprotein [Enterovibrio norvegicus]|uniref:TraV family lipoprotein n=1 Tax=Enterovibrio norvegicus TaxID=188144 RepID=UPI00352E33B1